MQTVNLNNGIEMPLLGFGVFQMAALSVAADGQIILYQTALAMLPARQEP